MLKKEKGITLIALIITIIVMLILVGVTINVALNGGLFQKAEEATKGTEEKTILEEMLAMMVIDDNGKFKPDEIISNMRTKHPEYEITYNKPNVIVKGKLGTYNYIVSETEIKIGEEKSKGYTFTLNQLGEWTDDGGDSGIVFKLSKVWEVIGEDLSLNSEYCVGDCIFAIKSTNKIFGDYVGIFYSRTEEIDSNMKYIVAAFIEDAEFRFVVLDTNGDEVIDTNPDENQMSYEEFFRLYGNTEFEIIKPNLVTAKAYVNSQKDYYYVFYSNGVFQLNSIDNSGGLSTEYENRGEQTLTVNGETKIYKNVIYIEGLDSYLNGTGVFEFSGYISEDNLEFHIFNGDQNQDGTYTGDWMVWTLDPDREI